MSFKGSSRHLSLTDIVNLASYINLDKALNLRYTPIICDKFLLYGTMRDVYAIGPIKIIRNWHYRGMDGSHSSPGYWVDTCFKGGGNDMISLKLHLANIFPLLRHTPLSDCSFEFIQEIYAQSQTEATEQSIVDDLVKRLEIDIHKPSVRQPDAFRGWSQAWVSASTPPFGGHPADNFGGHPADDFAGIWPDCRPDYVPFIGSPPTKYEMRDALGRVQQIIGSWLTESGTPFLLSFTLWHKEKDPPFQRWKFGRSTNKTCPYGLSAALANKDATIVIDDDLVQVDRFNCRLIDLHASASPIVFLAWPRGLDGATPSGTDWTHLAGRKVLVAVGNDQFSFLHALDLNDELQKVGAESVEFVLPKTSSDGKAEISVDYQGGQLRGVQKDLFEFTMIAKQQFGIPSRFEQKEKTSTVWKIGDGSSLPEAQLLMPPWLEEATVNLIYSEAGVGKSWFALLITHALASGGCLFGKFQAKRRFHCLYLAGEMISRMCRRIEEIHATNPSSDGAYNIEVYPHPDQNIGHLNLELAATWKTLEEFTKKADVIVIDHLTAFSAGHNSADSWSRIFLHLRRLTQQGKTILLLHHAGKNGQQRGTSILDDDIDTKIHLKKLDRIENGILVKYEKHRNDQTLGRALQPFQLHWDQGSHGRLYWWIADAEASEKKIWVPSPVSNNDFVGSVDEGFIRDNFDQREAEIVRCMAKGILKGKPGLKRPEIDDQLDVSSSTTLSVIKNLLTKGSVIAEGNGKATKYTLSEVIMKSVIRE